MPLPLEYAASATLDDAAERFRQDGYVELEAAFAPADRETIAREAGAVLDAAGRRCDLRVAVTSGSERRYRLASAVMLRDGAPGIARLYRSPQTLAVVSHIAGERVAPVPYAPEEFIATRFERAGDTHGWHWDDYSFALVWIIDAPDPDGGGELEYVRGVVWDKADPAVERHLRGAHIERRSPRAGSVYLLRADTALHRVAPLSRDGRRTMVCFSYASRGDLAREISHETIELIYA